MKRRTAKVNLGRPYGAWTNRMFHALLERHSVEYDRPRPDTDVELLNRLRRALRYLTDRWIAQGRPV